MFALSNSRENPKRKRENLRKEESAGMALDEWNAAAAVEKRRNVEKMKKKIFARAKSF